MAKPGTPRQPRTLLEAKIRERQQTYEEFVEYAERFARDHREVGTLSLRHLQRLAAGRRSQDRPLGPVQPSTARLLERIFGLPIAELLGPPTPPRTHDDSDAELRLHLVTARRIDQPTLDLLASQLNAIRQLDRRLGAAVTYREVTAKAEQITTLMTHSLTPATRTRLAELLSDAWSLAGWAALDLGHLTRSWQHHEQARAAAREADSPALLAHATAQQAVILIDLGDTDAALDQLDAARDAASAVPAVFGAWLTAAHGEGLAAAGRHADSLRAFDAADNQLPHDATEPSLPFVFLGGAHLTRWRGHAMATLRDPEAPTVLNRALRRLDPTFTRAEVSLRTDLATTLNARGQHDEARHHLSHAQRLATEIGSRRQLARLRALAAS
jgi:tetratricopeptide (TPR) repeat protein